jgi:hypothetical protein
MATPNYELAAERAAKRAGINPRIFKAMIRAESNFNPNAGSSAGAQGIAQFMPGTAPSYGVNLHDGRVTDDLNGAAKYIKEMLAKTGGNYHQALSMYNAGPGRPNGYKEIPETIAYVKKIMDGRNHETLQDGGATPSSAPASAPSVKTTKVTTPGVDNSGARASAALQFLRSKSKDPVYLAQQVQGLQDTPAVTKTTTTPTTSSAPAAGSKTGANGRVGGGPLKELFWQGPGGIDAKNGKLVPQGFVSGHTDHVHVASGPETTRRLGKLAQQMGLHVGENPAFGGVHPVHVANSYHYKDEAIDVSGDPAKMRAFAKRVAQMYGLKP